MLQWIAFQKISLELPRYARKFTCPISKPNCFRRGFITLVTLLAIGAGLSHFMSSTILNVTCRKNSWAGRLAPTNFPTSVITLQSLLACGVVGFHALAEGIALWIDAPKAYGLGRHMVHPVRLERRKGSVGMVMGVACAIVYLTFTRLVCL